MGKKLFYLGSAAGLAIGFVMGTKFFSKVLDVPPRIELSVKQPAVIETPKTL